MHVYVYIYVFTLIYIYIHTCAILERLKNIYSHIYTHKPTYTNICIFTYACVYRYIHKVKLHVTS